MALDFPASPSVNDLYTDSDRTWRWNGKGWAMLPGSPVAIGTTAADILSATAGVITADDAAADKLVFWDDSADKLTYLTVGSNLTITDTTIAANGDFLPTTFSANTITYAATVDLDMASHNAGYFTISLTGNLTFTTSNRAAGRTVTLRLICDGTQRTLTVPADWKFVGSKPANIAASKTAILSLSYFGTADTDCVAAYAVQT